MAPSGYPMAPVPVPIEFDIAEAVYKVLDCGSHKLSSTCKKTLFDTSYVPAVSIREYAGRLHTYCFCSDECHILALLYIERFLDCNSDVVLNELNVHRLLLTATVVAAKFQDDDHYSNKYYAKVGGVSLDELTSLEVHFLEMISWRAFVTRDDYNDCLDRLSRYNLSWCSPSMIEVCPTPEVQPCPTQSFRSAEANDVNMQAAKQMSEVKAPEGAVAVLARKAAAVRMSQWDCQHISRRKNWRRRPHGKAINDRRVRIRSLEHGVHALWKVAAVSM